MDRDAERVVMRAEESPRPTVEHVTRETYDADEAYFALMSRWYGMGLFDARIANVLTLADDLGPEVLDAGCGIGTFAIECAMRHSQVTAVDFSSKALSWCRRNAAQRGQSAQIRLVQCGVESLPFAAEQFDTVIAADIVEHVYVPGRFLREVRRVLKPGGQALFETPNAEFMAFPGRGLIFRNVVERLLPLSASVNRVPNPDPRFVRDYHVTAHSTRSFRDELEAAGLLVRRLDTRGWWLELRGYDRLFARILTLPWMARWGVRYRGTDIVAAAVRPSV